MFKCDLAYIKKALNHICKYCYLNEDLSYLGLHSNRWVGGSPTNISDLRVICTKFEETVRREISLLTKI